MTNVPSDRAEAKLNALSQAVSAITMEVSLDRILPRLAEITAHLVNARYAALGVPNNEGGMEQFFTYGMSEKQVSHMDHYPLGLGLLGLLLRERNPIRLADMADHEHSAGRTLGGLLRESSEDDELPGCAGHFQRATPGQPVPF